MQCRRVQGGAGQGVHMPKLSCTPVMASYSSSAAARKSQVAVAIALTVCE